MFWSFGNWDLGFVWDLELGIWDFLLTHLQGEEVYLSNLVRR
jgi:hypothetical protein